LRSVNSMIATPCDRIGPQRDPGRQLAAGKLPLRSCANAHDMQHSNKKQGANSVKAVCAHKKR
jgi:hypothetical protein